MHGGVRVCAWGGGGVGRAWGVCDEQEKWVSLAPLYYSDTLVNPDTCLGNLLLSFQNVSKTRFARNVE